MCHRPWRLFRYICFADLIILETTQYTRPERIFFRVYLNTRKFVKCLKYDLWYLYFMSQTSAFLRLGISFAQRRADEICVALSKIKRTWRHNSKLYFFLFIKIAHETLLKRTIQLSLSGTIQYCVYPYFINVNKQLNSKLPEISNLLGRDAVSFGEYFPVFVKHSKRSALFETLTVPL